MNRMLFTIKFVKIGGLEPPLVEPKSAVLPLHYISKCPTAVGLH